MPGRVLGDDPRVGELQQVVGPSGLRADAGEPVAAERLAADHRAGGAAVDVEVADRGSGAATAATVAGLRLNSAPVSANGSASTRRTLPRPRGPARSSAAGRTSRREGPARTGRGRRRASAGRTSRARPGPRPGRGSGRRLGALLIPPPDPAPPLRSPAGPRSRAPRPGRPAAARPRRRAARRASRGSPHGRAPARSPSTSGRRRRRPRRRSPAPRRRGRRRRPRSRSSCRPSRRSPALRGPGRAASRPRPRRISRPTALDPVNAITWTRGSRTSAAPTGPWPGSRRQRPGRDAGRAQGLDQGERGRRRLLGGLQDDGVAGGEGGGGHPGRDREREVPRRDHRGDAAGHVAHRVALARRLLEGGPGASRSASRA